jgi:hypothetical protein
MSRKYSWSHDSEKYNGNFDTRDDALNAAVDAIPDGEFVKHVYVAEVIDSMDRLAQLHKIKCLAMCNVQRWTLVE